MYALWYVFFGCVALVIVSAFLTKYFNYKSEGAAIFSISLLVIFSVTSFVCLLFSIISVSAATAEVETFKNNKIYYEEVLQSSSKEMNHAANIKIMEANEWLAKEKGNLKVYGAFSPYSIVEGFEELEPITIDCSKIE